MLKKLLLVSTTLLCVAAGSNLGIASSQKIVADERHEGSEILHHHKTMEIPAGQPIPSVDLSVHKDPIKGYNLQAKVSNFRFAL